MLVLRTIHCAGPSVTAPISAVPEHLITCRMFPSTQHPVLCSRRLPSANDTVSIPQPSQPPLGPPPPPPPQPAEPADDWSRFSALQQDVQQWLQQHEPLVQQPMVVNTLTELSDALSRHQVRWDAGGSTGDRAGADRWSSSLQVRERAQGAALVIELGLRDGALVSRSGRGRRGQHW